MGAQVRAALYVRQSRTDENGASASLETQAADLEALAERRGWLVVGVYVDPDAPADRLDKRERWLDLLADAEAGHFTLIAAYDSSRLWRSVELKISTFKALRAAGVSHVATLAGELSTDPDTDPEGGLVSTLLAAVSEFDNRMRAAKVRRARQQAAEAGKPHITGVRPWGYSDSYRSGVVESEAGAIREAARRVLAGDPAKVVAEALNRAGQRTTTGRPWTGSLLRQALLSPGLAGLRGHIRDERHRYDELYDGTWEPILARATWERLCEHFSGRRNAYTKNLLTGLGRCGRCGAKLTASRGGRGERLYRCRATEFTPERCGRLQVIAEPLEDEVRDQVLSVIDRELVAKHIAAAQAGDSDAEAAQAELLKLARRREEVGRDLARGADRAALMGFLGELDRQEAELRRRLRSADPGGIELLLEVVDDPPAWWAANPDVHRRRALLQLALVEVRVKPAGPKGRRPFDPARAGLIWRY